MIARGRKKGQKGGWKGRKGKGKGKGTKGKGKGSKGKGKNGEQWEETRNCHNCGKKGHLIADCPEPRRSPGQAAAATEADTEPPPTTTAAAQRRTGRMAAAVTKPDAEGFRAPKRPVKLRLCPFLEKSIHCNNSECIDTQCENSKCTVNRYSEYSSNRFSELAQVEIAEDISRACTLARD